MSVGLALAPHVQASAVDQLFDAGQYAEAFEAVSYTHLTLPTIYSV